MTLRMVEYVNSEYSLVELDSFVSSLSRFARNAERKVREKILDMLSTEPYRYTMLRNLTTVNGIKVAGLRHMKVGAKGVRGGIVVLYRVCEECLQNEYYVRSGIRCEFCDEDFGKRVVLFIAYPRGRGYK